MEIGSEFWEFSESLNCDNLHYQVELQYIMCLKTF